MHNYAYYKVFDFQKVFKTNPSLCSFSVVLVVGGGVSLFLLKLIFLLFTTSSTIMLALSLTIFGIVGISGGFLISEDLRGLTRKVEVSKSGCFGDLVMEVAVETSLILNLIYIHIKHRVYLKH